MSLKRKGVPKQDSENNVSCMFAFIISMTNNNVCFPYVVAII